VGLISDTHGLVRPEALAALEGSDLIVHAGDVGSYDVLAALERLGRVVAVRGNVDGDLWADRLPWSQRVEFQGVHLYVLHDYSDLDLDPIAAGVQVVVFGHSHQPSIARRGGVLYVNPGSAGPRRFRLPIAVGKLHIGGPRPTAEIIELEIR